MRIGAMRHRIIIEKNTPTRSGTGAEVESWATFVTVWSQRKDEPGREFVAGDQKVAKRKRVYLIRWRAGLDEEMRVNDGGEVWDIHSINELGNRAALEILATRQVT